MLKEKISPTQNSLPSDIILQELKEKQTLTIKKLRELFEIIIDLQEMFKIIHYREKKYDVGQKLTHTYRKEEDQKKNK